MQLSFDLPGGSPLTEAQGRLFSRFGPQRAEKRHDPITQLVTMCLCARTRDEIGAVAVERLAARFPDWSQLLSADAQEIETIMGWVSRHANSAEKAYELLMALVPPEWDADDLYEMHWLMKRLGRSTCKHAKPNCPECPLRNMCAFYLRSHPEPVSDGNERDAEIRDRTH